MKSARYLVAVLLLVGATLAACSGNFGSGTTPPNGLLPSGNLGGISPTPTPTPSSASNIVTYGTLTTFQPLPNVAGYGGAIAFPVPSPKPSGFSEVAIGATLSIVSPADAPDLNLLAKGKKGGTKRGRSARALVYLTLIPTHDMTLEAYPRIALDVPRDIVTVYRENEFGIALYNAGAKDTTYKLAAAELDTASTPPPVPTANPSAPPPPSAIPLTVTPSPSPGASAPSPVPSPGSSGATAAASTARAAGAGPAASPTLPPQRITFAGTAATLKLTANRPVVFALYALPVETPAPSPSPKKGAAAKAGASPEATGSASPAASPQASGSPVPVATGSSAAVPAVTPSAAAPAPSPARS
jgi:hypothetical protein